MLRAVHHALAHQFLPDESNGSHFDAERRRDVSRAVRAGAKFRHGAHVILFAWSQSIQAHPEEPLVESSKRCDRRALDIVGHDGRFRRNVPRACAPLLEKVRVTVRSLDDRGERSRFDVGALATQRLTNRTLGICALFRLACAATGDAEVISGSCSAFMLLGHKVS